MLERLSSSSFRTKVGPGLGLGMRFGRRKAEVTRSAKQSTLEQLYELAHSTFKLRKDVFPSEVERVRELLSAIPLHEIGMEDYAASAASELGIGEKKGFLQRFGLSGANRLPAITYMHVCENESFGIGIFCIPAGVRLPFHDHPQMTVFSRVLYGEIEIQAYDWVKANERSKEYGDPKPAKLSVERSVKADDPPIILHATTGGNIHSFKANKACAILDLLAPPYDMKDPDRQCTYYKEVSGTHEDQTVMLEKIPDPNTFRIASSRYLGIQVE